MAAYHLEALRRQRVIDRKLEALSRLSFRQVSVKTEPFALLSSMSFSEVVTG